MLEQFIPNTYDMKDIETKFISMEEFKMLQMRYRENLETFLLRMIDFKSIDKYINDSGVIVPVLEDKEYNIYHRNSNLGSAFIYLRNNIHIERLTENELRRLKEETVDFDFILETIKEVIFEDGDEMFFGAPINENKVLSKSIILEFAYDQKKCKNLQQLNDIDKLIKFIFTFLEEKLADKINIPISCLVYNAIPDIFNKNINEVILIK